MSSKCEKCFLIKEGVAARHCEVKECPQKMTLPAERTGSEVLTSCQQISQQGIGTHEQFGAFASKMISEILDGRVGLPEAKTVAVFSRQLLDTLNIIHKSQKP